MVRQCAQAGAVVDEIYRQLQVSIDQRQPVCAASGKCCGFDRYGHRLFVTPLELGVFLERLAGQVRMESQELAGKPLAGQEKVGKVSLAVLSEQADGGGCRFQSGGLCSVHGIRPFGCRIFFCDPTAEQWQQAEYERFHGQIKVAHEVLGIPYLYVEWRMAFRTSCFAEATQDSVER